MFDVYVVVNVVYCCVSFVYIYDINFVISENLVLRYFFKGKNMRIRVMNVIVLFV